MTTATFGNLVGWAIFLALVVGAAVLFPLGLGAACRLFWELFRVGWKVL